MGFGVWRLLKRWSFARGDRFAGCENKPPAPAALPPRGLLVASFAESEGMPPALRAAPQNGGRLGEEFGVEVRIGCPHETHRRSRSAPAQNTNVREATRAPPKLGGQRRRRGGHVLALCTTSNKKPPVSGGSAAGAGGLFPRSAKRSQQAKRQPLDALAKKGAASVCCSESDDSDLSAN